ncbi:hypothetical protein ACO0RG_001313 [Hanseniaspora osmophila]|uniref:Protein HLJ1 n=1 Tax=Hanseniaspora osmophila TaxID=56408 RepID=A0A1E5RNH8_9ASCO|nr:Protein HLJ1 [Hanseniaspora osmophila]
MAEREYTKEQESVTLEVLKHDKHDFYKILKIEKTSNDLEIKKAYRKMAIKLHPDKNSFPRAAEAFKRVNRAFEVLSDEQKRKIFDQLGVDPDDRHAASAAGRGNPGSAFRSTNDPFRQQGSPFGGPGGMGFASPEDFFQHFAFGGPFGGGPFGGGGNGFQTFTFDPSTRTFHSRSSGAQRRRNPDGTTTTAGERQRQNRENQEEDFMPWRIIMPFLLLFLFQVFEKLLR